MQKRANVDYIRTQSLKPLFQESHCTAIIQNHNSKMQALSKDSHLTSSRKSARYNVNQEFKSKAYPSISPSRINFHKLRIFWIKINNTIHSLTLLSRERERGKEIPNSRISKRDLKWLPQIKDSTNDYQERLGL